MSGLSKCEHIAKAGELFSLCFGKFFPQWPFGSLKPTLNLIALTPDAAYTYVQLFILLTPLARSLQKFSRLCEETGTENETELKESRTILACNPAPQPNEAHMTVSGSRVRALSKRILRSENHFPFISFKSSSPDKVRSIHPNVDYSVLLIGFCSELKSGPKRDDNFNDAPKYALFRPMPENWVAQRPRVSPEFQPL